MECEMRRTGSVGDIRGAHRGWLIHATVYVAVNLLLVVLALLQGRAPLLVPAFAWGIGLAIHGIVVFALVGRRKPGLRSQGLAEFRGRRS